MDNIVNLVLSYNLFIALSICHIKLLIAAWQIDLLVANICSNNILLSNNLAQGINEGYTNLSLAPGNKDLPAMLDN